MIGGKVDAPVRVRYADTTNMTDFGHIFPWATTTKNILGMKRHGYDCAVFRSCASLGGLPSGQVGQYRERDFIPPTLGSQPHEWRPMRGRDSAGALTPAAHCGFGEAQRFGYLRGAAERVDD